MKRRYYGRTVPVRLPRAPKGYKFSYYKDGGLWCAHLWKKVGREYHLEITGPAHGSRTAAIRYLRGMAADMRESARLRRWSGLTREQKIAALKRSFRSSFLCFTMSQNEAILTIGVERILDLIEGKTP